MQRRRPHICDAAGRVFVTGRISVPQVAENGHKPLYLGIVVSYQWSTRSRPETALFARSRSRPEICFRNFGSDRDFTDVTLAHVDEREEFSHRNILSSASTKKLAQTKYIEINLSIVLLVQLPLFPQPHLPEEGEVGLQHHQVHHLLAPVPGVRSLKQCNS